MTLKEVFIDKKQYIVQSHEFNKIPHVEYCNLHLLTDVDFVEKNVGLLRDLRDLREYLFFFNIVTTDLENKERHVYYTTQTNDIIIIIIE